MRDYWRAVREHAWETFWGAGVLGVVFTAYTLYYPPARPYIPWAVAWAILVAGYFIWRADHVRLLPKMTLGPLDTALYARTGVANQKRRYVQVIVACATEGPLEICRGQLLRISEWVDGKWEATHISETLDLLWSYVDEPTVTVEHGAPRRLDLLFVENTSRDIVLWTRMRIKLASASAPTARFKFDVRVAAKDCPPKYISIKVTFGDHWDDLTAEIMGNEP
jgi:hypothetical protein